MFSMTHIIFGTSVFIGLAIHWNTMILYIYPILIYYLTSLGPYIIKVLGDHLKGRTKIMGVEHIIYNEDCVEVAFRLGRNIPVRGSGWNAGGAALKICATQYVRIYIPEILSIWHPFTCFYTPSRTENVTGTNNENLNVIFRCYGIWTTNLATRLGDPGSDRPTILVDGFYGGADQLSQALRHDTIIIVAGGIGTVSYISMVRLLHLTLMTENGGGG